ncbi:hypothetical protein N7495_008099 [Penicillium taxi]|uniref:uncharacterized protein n=1 Tax=Penicillium taxi TaxID=168475 RepID=UPI002544F91F|nr:uncharacterized protein N7495_008099 [Penicillium taxi]KAJ5888058.1 hypothetical protein N7495_008099 [Penicillium taxi]
MTCWIGEKAYHDCYQAALFHNNPYRWIGSSYAPGSTSYNSISRPDATCYTGALRRTISLNAKLNSDAQAAIDAIEPAMNIWPEEPKPAGMKVDATSSSSRDLEAPASSIKNAKSSRFSGLKKTLSIMSPEARAAAKATKAASQRIELRSAILTEESSRWPDAEWRQIVATHQAKVGITQNIAELRARQPIQYLHLLRAGYFEPIPVAWADNASNPLKFTIDSAAGWRGITPAWRGFEDTAEERLYWVLNHRQSPTGQRMKPDIISAMNMALSRMASAVEPPPTYFSIDDTCHLQHKSKGY